MRLFHVQTLVDGRWRDFTKLPIKGEQEAESHLHEVREWALSVGHGYADVRLRELSEDDVKEHIVVSHKEAFVRHLKSMEIEDLMAIVRGNS